MPWADAAQGPLGFQVTWLPKSPSPAAFSLNGFGAFVLMHEPGAPRSGTALRSLRVLGAQSPDFPARPRANVVISVHRATPRGAVPRPVPPDRHPTILPPPAVPFLAHSGAAEIVVGRTSRVGLKSAHK